MSSNNTTDVINSVTDIVTLEYDSILNEAIKIFTDQALITKKADEVTLQDIQLAKGKSENFLASIAGLIEISHKVELLSAERHKFKRKDELELLNSLREQFHKSAKFSNKIIDSCLSRLDALEERMSSNDTLKPEDFAEFMMLQNYMNSAIETLTAINTGTGKLIKTERESGGRSGNDSKVTATNISNFLSGLASDSKGKNIQKTNKPRKLSQKEVLQAMGESAEIIDLESSLEGGDDNSIYKSGKTYNTGVEKSSDDFDFD